MAAAPPTPASAPPARSRPDPRRRAAFIAITIGLLVGLDLGLGTVVSKIRRGEKNESETEKRYRIANPSYHHGLLPRFTAPDALWGDTLYPIATNSLGFRDGEPREVASRPPGRSRLLIAGDSFTEGLGIVWPETFAGRAAQALAPEGIEVLNEAVSSYSPVIHVARLRSLLADPPGLSIQEMIVFIDISDAYDEARWYQTDAAGSVIDRPKPKKVRGARRFVERHSLVWNAGMLFGARMRAARYGAFGPLEDRRSIFWERGGWAIDPALFEAHGREGLDLAAKHMDELHALARSSGIRLAVAIYPWPHQIVRRDLDSPHRRFWRAWAERAHVPLLDLFPAFIQEAEAPLATCDRLFIPGDVHWNSAGHELVARKLVEFYRSRPWGR